MKKKFKGFTIVELLVIVLILGILVSIALPFYLKSVSDSEINTCKTNMSSIAAAEQAQKVREGGAYYTGAVDSTAAATNGPLRDLHLAVPQCPGNLSEGYTAQADGNGGFIIRCTNPKHKFQWHNGRWENY